MQSGLGEGVPMKLIHTLLFATCCFCSPAIAETWQCQLAFTGRLDATRLHTFTRVDAEKYIHTFVETYYSTDRPAKEVTETRVFNVAAEQLTNISLVHSESPEAPTYATLFMLGAGTATYSQHLSNTPAIAEHGLCKIACTSEDRQRMIGADHLCDSY